MRDRIYRFLQASIITAASLMLLFSFSCGQKQTTPEQAKQKKEEILGALPLLPGSELRSVKVDVDKSALIASFGSNADEHEAGDHIKNAVKAKGWKVVDDMLKGISYEDPEGRLVTIMWYPRDPDLSGYKCVCHVAVQPLPPEIAAHPEAVEE